MYYFSLVLFQLKKPFAFELILASIMNLGLLCVPIISSCPYNLKEIYTVSSDILSGDGLLLTLSTPTVNGFKEIFGLLSLLY